jgi:hypothetical protein
MSPTTGKNYVCVKLRMRVMNVWNELKLRLPGIKIHIFAGDIKLLYKHSFRVNWYLTVSLSVCPNVAAGVHWTDFCEMWYLWLIWISVPLKSYYYKTTRKENNWKTKEKLEGAIVALEAERIKGSNPLCLRWLWLWISVEKIQIWLKSGTLHEDLSSFYCYWLN